MATRIRLRRVGRKKQPEYRIVVIERTKSRDGRFIETIGHYNPRHDPAGLSVDVEKARAWLAKGATPSGTVHSLLKQAGAFRTAGAGTAAASDVGTSAAADPGTSAAAGETAGAGDGPPAD